MDTYRNDSAPGRIGLLHLSADGKPVAANLAMLEMLEVESVAELHDIPSHELIPADLRTALEKEPTASQSPSETLHESVLAGRRGTCRQVIVSGLAIKHGSELVGMVATFVDVTRSRHAEDALDDTLERYRAVVNALGDGVVVVSNKGDIVEANASAFRILGVPEIDFGNVYDRPIDWHLRDEQGRELAIDEMPAVVTLRTGKPCRNVVFQTEPPHGKAVWLSVNTEPMFLEPDPLPTAVVVSFHDISDLKEANRLSSVREARLSRLLDAIPDLLFVISNEGIFLDYRARRPELLYRPPEEFLGRSLEEFFPPELAAPRRRLLQRTVATGREQSLEYSTTLLGSQKYFEARLSPYESGTVLMLVRDITEARLAEQRLRQHEQERVHLGRLGALGEMVAGISHEINQPLHAIANFAAASLNVLDSGDSQALDQIRDWLQKIARQAFRASEIVKRFRQFSSPIARITTVPVSEFLTESVELAAGELRRRNVYVEVVNEADDLPFVADRIQIQQVLVNFLINAAEALDANDIKDRHVNVAARIVDGKLLCEVADDGPGLPDIPPPQLFDAFYTTKPNGLGLGLPICRTIIESHGGRIWARPNTPRGAIFGFEIPPASVS